MSFLEETFIYYLNGIASLTEKIYQKYLSQHTCAFIFLEGELGAGKTTFVRALGKTLHIKENINSPSFNLLNVYKSEDRVYRDNRKNGGLILYHYDLYRMKNIEELEQLDFIERWTSLPKKDTQLFHLIEWPQIALDFFPKDIPSYHLLFSYLLKSDGSYYEEKREVKLYKDAISSGNGL